MKRTISLILAVILMLTCIGCDEPQSIVITNGNSLISNTPVITQDNDRIIENVSPSCSENVDLNGDGISETINLYIPTDKDYNNDTAFIAILQIFINNKKFLLTLDVQLYVREVDILPLNYGDRQIVAIVFDVSGSLGRGYINVVSYENNKLVLLPLPMMETTDYKDMGYDAEIEIIDNQLMKVTCEVTGYVMHENISEETLSHMYLNGEKLTEISETELHPIGLETEVVKIDNKDYLSIKQYIYAYSKWNGLGFLETIIYWEDSKLLVYNQDIIQME